MKDLTQICTVVLYRQSLIQWLLKVSENHDHIIKAVGKFIKIEERRFIIRRRNNLELEQPLGTAVLTERK